MRSALRRPAGAHDPRFVGEDHGLHAVAQIELHEDPGDVGLHRGLADDERLRDLRVGQAARDEARGPPVRAGSGGFVESQGRVSARAGRAREKSSISRRVTDGASSASPPPPPGSPSISSLGRAVLEQEAARPGAQRVVDVLVEVEGRQDRARAAGLAPREDPPGRLDAVDARASGRPSAPRRAQPRARGDRLGAVGRLADHLDVGLGARGSSGSRPGPSPGRRRAARGSSTRHRVQRQPRARPAKPPSGPRPGRAACRRRAATRSRMPTRPCPPLPVVRPPAAAVVDHLDLDARRSPSRTRHLGALARPACLSALVSASWTIRYAARSTACGSGRARALDVELHVEAARRARSRPARRCRPPRAGGPRRLLPVARRTPSDRRISPERSCGRCPRSWPTATSARAGSRSMTLRAPWACMTMTPTLCATTSCSSRAIRARSSASAIRVRCSCSKLASDAIRWRREHGPRAPQTMASRRSARPTR